MKKENLTVEQAVEQLLLHTKAMSDTEEVSLLEARGRILACDMVAGFDNPPFDRSPVDGYACRAADTKGASREHPVQLKVMEEIDAGQYSEREIQPGQAVRIMTGAAIPAGCDCCIYQEKTDYGEDFVEIYAEHSVWDNYCFSGEDFKKGKVLLSQGARIGFVEAGVLAGMGASKAEVYRRPRVTLITTGDEVTDPGKVLQPGKIYNSNQTLLAARLMDFGVDLVEMASVEDCPKVMAEKMKQVVKNSDLIITTGAVSVGKKDIMHETIELIGADRVFWGVQMKPGMPTLFSVYQGVPVLSLSGNPFGVAVTVEILIRPLLAKMMRDDSLGLVRRTGIVQNDFGKPNRGRRFIRAFWENGKITLPNALHSNGVLASMAGCNCLVDMQPGGPQLKAGMEAEVVML